MPQDILPEEAQILEKAGALDQLESDAAQAVGPTGEFEVNVLNQVVDALNLLMPAFGLPAYPEFTEDIDGDLPAEFIKQLQMVADAANDAGMERLAYDVSEVESAQDMEDIAAKLDVLSKNEAFTTFLRSERNEAEEDVESPVEAEAVVVDEAIPAQDLESIMAQRA
tara:strand:+ start:122 stop:622 length:501 start_codon:yes stop_codon:yes gene_type:complete